MKFSKKIFNKKTIDYTFIVLFFLTFSIFVFFAIGPSLKTAFSLKKEEEDLKKIDNLYEKKIFSVSYIQSAIEKNRDDLYLIDKAVTESPNVNKVIDDIKTAADKNNFSIIRANVSDINLLRTKRTLDKVKVVIEGKSTFPDFLSFIEEVHQQRRLKTIDDFLIKKDTSINESTKSGELLILINVSGYYL